MKGRSRRAASRNGPPTKAELAAELAALRKGQASLERRAARARTLAAALRGSEERNRGAEAEATRLAEITATLAASLEPDRVLDSIVKGAIELLRCDFALVYRYDQVRGGLTPFRWRLADATRAVEWEGRLARLLIRPGEGVAGRVFQERRPLWSGDLGKDTIAHYTDEQTQTSISESTSATLGAPIVIRDEVYGVLNAGFLSPRDFKPQEVRLIQALADHAAIAIANARLYTESETRARDLAEALEQQTATAEILRVISGSPTDVQPTFDALASSARRLCGATDVEVALRRDDTWVTVAHDGTLGTSVGQPRPLRGSVFGRAIVESRTIHIPRASELDPREFPLARDLARDFGWRAMLAVPLLREGVAIGIIGLRRAEEGAFTPRQIELLETFAAQAVIAIENVRLFTELQASNRDLTEALDTQTATSEILRVISQSQTDVQPVFDTIVRNAVQLCGGVYGVVYRLEGDLIHLAALHNFTQEQLDQWQRTFPRPLRGDDAPSTRVIRTGVVYRAADLEVELDPDISPEVRANWRVRGVRSLLVVPMFRHHEVIGAIGVTHREVGAFTDAHVELLKTFADQAVIAIENARLFDELQARTAELTRSVGELTALGDVSHALSSTLDLETVLHTIVMRANQLAGTAGCTIWEYDEAREEFRLRVGHYPDEADAMVLQAPGRVTTMPRGLGVMTRVAERRQPVQIPDIAVEGAYESPIRPLLIEAGHRALLGVPLLREDKVIGVLTVTRKTPGEFEPEIVRLLSTFATQSALAIQNARLFLEIEDKSRQLEVASQHKSEFLANMSHELRTPLNAIIGFSEVLAEGMFGEINEKQTEYLGDILESGRHLLSLINDILDLSKIEAGRMELDADDFDLPSAIENALILVRERASRRGITLAPTIDERLGTIRADERKVKQVLLNLLSNALKFTPEGGRVDVHAGVNEDMAEISVADTGVGIAPEDQQAVFEEFRQVGAAAKKVEGTGLGLALSRKFIELHGGRIWVKSEIGVGSTFTFTLPLPRRTS